MGERVDQRHEAVGDEDGEGDAVGKVAKVADGNGERADEDAIEKAAARRGRGGNRVCCDKAGAEDDGAAHQLAVGVERERHRQPKGEGGGGGADEGRDEQAPVGGAGGGQPDATDEPGEVEQLLLPRRVEGSKRLARDAQDAAVVEQGGGAGRVHAEQGDGRGGHAAHLRREADEQHGKADHCRVERVLPEAAVEVFAEEDGEGDADERYPPRREYGQRQGEQHGGHEDAAVAQGGVGLAS